MADLRTTSQVIDALGGTCAVGRLVGRQPPAVTNWRERGFPPETFLIFQHLLAERGLRAPAALWKMVEPRGRVA
jgi:hypothetical protein